jgi:hypothetical protein
MVEVVAGGARQMSVRKRETLPECVSQIQQARQVLPRISPKRPWVMSYNSCKRRVWTGAATAVSNKVTNTITTRRRKSRMSQRIAPSEQKAQALQAMLAGQTDGQSGEELLST